ncbi:DNA polymerase Y family protein [Thalassotalea sp. LPB0316]|uniref:Y-family DNA polymerase n=1 Tax=Thalassotalea sp. LPB0316 TaxID=2769490 RepID=UPI0018663E59|nr:DNA polymerase Y family protein [Thalassotalea sp. LPB0316]QOL27172.1 DNA polymerase Y family protein [Thalassotalea sp. LPB0316]
MSLWLYLHFPALQLDSLFGDETLPVAIVDSKASTVVQCNVLAVRSGIKLGMGLGVAATLCHQLQVHPYQEQYERDKLKQIANWLYLVTADISLFEPDGLLIKVSDMLSLYPNLTTYWQAVQEHLNKLGVRYYYASAYSVYGARLLARAHENNILDDKQQLAQSIGSYSLEATDLPSKTVINLRRVGIQTIADLQRLALADIGKRFGLDIVTYIGKLTGQLKHPVEYYHPPEQFLHYLELLYEMSNLDWLKKPLSKVYSLLETFLRMRNKHARELIVTLHLRDKADQSLTVAAGQGEYKADKWLTLTLLRFESLTLQAPVVGITVQAKHLIHSVVEKNDLFVGRQGELSANELIAMLQAKLGNNQVQGVKAIYDHRPEYATKPCQPLQTNRPIEPQSVGVQPGFILPTPLPLQEKVVIEHGPSRIAAGWWDDNEVIRDYFIARTESGRWLWVFRTPEQHWFVHGLFS